MTGKYVSQEIELQWQKRWEDASLFNAEPDPGRKKFYITVA